MEEKEEVNTIAYVYKWVELSTQKWYIGSRTAKCCHPNDGYICSSRTVKPLIQNNPEDWVRTIIETGSPKEMLKLEVELLTTLDAKNNPKSFNMHNGDGKFSTAGVDCSPEHRAKISAANKGRAPHNRGKPHSHETIAKMGVAKIKTIIATNLGTGETFEINGKQEMKALGFTSSNVSACANGKRASHKGHSFRFKDAE